MAKRKEKVYRWHWKIKGQEGYKTSKEIEKRLLELLESKKAGKRC